MSFYRMLISTIQACCLDWLPKVFKDRFFTSATKDLATLLLGDSARIQENDLARINKRREKRGETLLENLYTEDDVAQTIAQMQAVNFREEVSICEEVSAYFTDTGHILGSAAISLTIKEGEKSIHVFFSGDIGRPHDKFSKSRTFSTS
jgi:metallo-beta-lactamase family protein